MSRILNTIIIILLLVSSAFLFWTYYNQLPSEQRQFLVSSNEELNVNATNQLSMFMENMRFDTNNISYSFAECNKKSQDKMKQAFQIVSNDTGNIYFYESQSAKIIIYCSQQKGEQRNTTFVAGEGGPNKVILLDLYPLIVDGKIYLYKQENEENCEYPVVELHELMHVFGFDHINKTNEILYPYVNCEQRITPDIINELKSLYAEKPKVDLTLQNLSAIMHGKYLNFNVTILNRGLISTTNVSLKVSSAEKTIETIEIDDLSPGISQIITVKNILVKTNNQDNITFKVTTNEEEYFYENNQLTANLQQ